MTRFPYYCACAPDLEETVQTDFTRTITIYRLLQVRGAQENFADMPVYLVMNLAPVRFKS